MKIGLITCLCLLLPLAAANTEPLAYKEQTLILAGVHQNARIPQGYRLEFLARMDGPRMLTFATNGDLLVGSKSGKIYRLQPPYTQADVLVQLNNYPHSVALRNNEILIAQTDGLYHAPYQPGQAKIAAETVRLLAALPGGSGHNSRTVRIGHDGLVYVSLGIRGNCSDNYLDAQYPFEEQRGGVLVLREEGGKVRWETFASGLRNPVGFDWQPKSGVMYASNNGPDHLGFEQPPEYFSRLTAGSFHGMPWFLYDGKQIRRDDCIAGAPPRPLSAVTAPVATFPARNAPMAVTFVPAGAMDASLALDAIVALHGSWGTPLGGGAASRRPPKVVVVRFQSGKAMRVDDLISGFQSADGQRWARPVGVAIGPDGALYFTSDSDINGLFRLQRMH